MAYMTQDDKGPFPNKAGEYCGNHLPGSPAPCKDGETREEAEKRDRAYLARMRFGRPRPCAAGTTEEMEARGFVGLYMKETRPIYFGGTEVDTPDELKEPVCPVCEGKSCEVRKLENCPRCHGLGAVID